MRRAIYPWLLCVYPIAYLYSENFDLVQGGQVPVTVAISLAVTTIVYLVLRFATGHAHESALTTAIVVAVFFVGGHLAGLAQSPNAGFIQSSLLPVALAVAALIVFRVWWRVPTGDFGAFNLSLNVVGLGLLILPSVTIGRHLWRVSTHEVGQLIEVGEKPKRVAKVMNDAEHPDVYFIVADGYSSNAHLQRSLQYDNSRFTDALEEMGFFVAYDSKSNYGGTLHSMASVLNMRYVPKNTAGSSVDGLAYLHILIADSLVARLMIEAGYTHLHLLSGLLIPSSIADVNVDFSPAGVMEYSFLDLRPDLQKLDKKSIEDGRFLKRSFHQFLVDTTLLYAFSGKISAALEVREHRYRWMDPKRFFDTLEKLKTIPEMPEATFTIVHLLKPHGPVQLDRQGMLLDKSTWNPTRQQFFDEFEFVNEHYLDMLKTLVEKSEFPPVIVFQGDHGTTLGRVWVGGRLTQFEIMNAFYTPGGRPASLERDISSVNTFRVLLNEYFDGDNELLEPKQFEVVRGYRRPFWQVDVTDEFR